MSDSMVASLAVLSQKHMPITMNWVAGLAQQRFVRSAWHAT